MVTTLLYCGNDLVSCGNDFAILWERLCSLVGTSEYLVVTTF